MRFASTPHFPNASAHGKHAAMHRNGTKFDLPFRARDHAAASPSVPYVAKGGDTVPPSNGIGKHGMPKAASLPSPKSSMTPTPPTPPKPAQSFREVASILSTSEALMQASVQRMKSAPQNSSSRRLFCKERGGVREFAVATHPRPHDSPISLAVLVAGSYERHGDGNYVNVPHLLRVWRTHVIDHLLRAHPRNRVHVFVCARSEVR